MKNTNYKTDNRFAPIIKTSTTVLALEHLTDND